MPLLAFALAALTVAVYAQVRHHGFVSLDDTVYVSENEHVARGLTASGLAWAFTSTDNAAANWHPVTWVSHMIDVELFGLDAGAHHAVSVAIHALNAAILFLLLAAMTRHAWRSALVAALFAAHPLHVESVAWIAERKDVLSACFWLLATAAYVGWTRRRGAARYALVAGLFALALMAKPMAVTLPFTLLLLDWWPLGRLAAAAPPGEKASPSGRVRAWGPLLVEKWPLFALSALSAAMTVVAQRQAGAVVALEAIPLSQRVANAAVSYAVYAWQTIWPAHLSVFYPHEGPAHPAAIAGAMALLVGVSAVAVLAARSRPHVAVGWLWYLGTLAPVIGLVQVGMQSRADRYTYLPLVGLFVALAWELADRVGRRPGLRAAVAAACVALVAGSAWAARAQAACWRDEASLWRQALEVNGDNYYARYATGRLLVQEGRVAEALAHLEAARARAPWFAEIHDTLGLAYAASGRLDEAVAEHLEALRLKPGLLAARFNLGVAHERRGRLDEAAAAYREVIARAPGKAVFRAALGHLLASQGRLDEAAAQLREALRLEPGSPQARYALATVLADRRETAEAAAELRRLLETTPGFAPAHALLGSLLAGQGQAGEAVTHLREAARLEPASADARSALGAILADTGRLDEAVAAYGEAVALAPGDPGLRHAFGVCLARQGRVREAAGQFAEAARLRPGDAGFEASLGMALAAAGDHRAAAGHLRAALAIDPANQAAKAGLQALAPRARR